MMSIKQKIGPCMDCGAGPDKPIIARRCHYHYWAYRNKVNAAKPSRKVINDEAQQRQLALDKWYAEQINQLPRCCENCNDYLNPYAPWGAKSYIAHLVPKRNFESVECHPDNRVYLCVICHGNFDTWPEAKVMLMPVFPIVVERFMQVAPSIEFEELNSLPGYFKAILND